VVAAAEGRRGREKGRKNGKEKWEGKMGRKNGKEI
jgi:hypothetical protein